MRLKELARTIAKVYKQNPKVEAVLLGGSVSRNWEDNYSDIELLIFWKESPSDEDRMASINKLEGNIIDFFPFEEEEWSETYTVKGVKLEISNFLTTTIQTVIEDVVMKYETDLDKQCLVAAVNDGQAMCGSELIDQLKKKVEVYPTELSEAMILENIELGSRWNNREALLNREDYLMLYKVIVSVQTNLMGILFGLNKKYVHHPAFKWQKQSFDLMELLPNDAYNRFRSILLNDPKLSVSELEVIILEIYRLVEQNLPSLNLSHFIERSQFLRPKNKIST